MKQIYKQLGKVRPTVEGDWSIDKAYTLLSIVYDEVGNASYISRKDVPVGIQITNKEYWTRFSNTRVNSDSIVLLSKIQDDGLINSYDLQEAIDSFKVEDRRLGTFISFYEKPIGESTDYRWNLYQFNSNNIDDWNNIKYWQSIYYIQNKFLGLFSSEESLKRTRPFPIIGDYAFVGATLKEAVVYRCNNIGVWTRTNEKAKDYLSINLKGDITISEEGNWVIDGVDTGISSKGEDGKTPLLRIKDYKWQVSYDGGVIYKDIPNSPIFVKEDDEDIVGDLQTDGVKLLKFADKEYNASKFSGLGRVYLRKNVVNGKNVLTQEMINKPNTIYIIQYNYDLNNIQINIQENCILKFEGGSFINGSLNGNKTVIEALPYQIFNNVNILGTYNIEYSYCEWVGAKGNGISDDSDFIQKCLNCFYTLKLLPNTKYFITKNIEIKTYRTLIGDKSSIIKANGTFKLFKLGHTSKLYGFSIFMEKPQTAIIITSKYVNDSYFEMDKTPNAWKYRSDANILVRDLNINALNEDDLTSDINCIESLSNGEGTGFWQVFMDNIKIHGKYNYAIYINNGQKAGINFATWQTDFMFRDIKINKCFNGIYIGSDDEVGAYNHFPPEAMTFDNVSMQYYKEYAKHFAVLTNCNKIVFKNCQPWDWTNPKDIFYINPNKTPDLRIEGIYNNSQYNLFTFSEPLNKGKSFEAKISSDRDGINDILYDLAFMYSDEELNKRATCGLLRRLTPGIYMIYSDLRYNTFFGITNDDFIGFHFGPYIMEVIHARNNIFIKFTGQYLAEFNEQGFLVIKNDMDDNMELPKINYYQQKIKTFNTLEDFKQINAYKYNYFGFVKEPNNNVPKLIYKLKDNYYVESDGREFSSNFGQNFPTLNKTQLNSLGKCFYNTIYDKVFFFSKNGEWRDGEGNLPGIVKKGTTAQRPTGVQIGFTYKDTDLNKWIIWNGEAWENIDGTALG